MSTPLERAARAIADRYNRHGQHPDVIGPDVEDARVALTAALDRPEIAEVLNSHVLFGEEPEEYICQSDDYYGGPRCGWVPVAPEDWAGDALWPTEDRQHRTHQTAMVIAFLLGGAR